MQGSNILQTRSYVCFAASFHCNVILMSVKFLNILWKKIISIFLVHDICNLLNYLVLMKLRKLV